MATKNVTYQFDGYFETYDRTTEADLIAKVESENNYIAKFDVSIPEREIIDDPETEVLVVNEGLVLIPENGEARIVS